MAEELASKEKEAQKPRRKPFLLGNLFRGAVWLLFAAAVALFALYAAGCYPLFQGMPFSDALQARILRLCLFASIALCAASAAKIVCQIVAAFAAKKSALLSLPVFAFTLLSGAALAFASSFILSASEGSA